MPLSLSQHYDVEQWAQTDRDTFCAGELYEPERVTLAAPVRFARGFCGSAENRTQWVDLNYDGKADMVCDARSGDHWYRLASSNGKVSDSVQKVGGFCSQRQAKPSSRAEAWVNKTSWLDVDGDGVIDLLCSDRSGNHWHRHGKRSGSGQLALKPAQKHLNGFCAEGGTTSWANIDKIFKPNQMEHIQNQCQESCEICTAFLPKDKTPLVYGIPRTTPKVELHAMGRVVEMQGSGKLVGRVLGAKAEQLLSADDADGDNDHDDAKNKRRSKSAAKTNPAEFDVFIEQKKRLRCVTRFSVKTSTDGNKWKSVQSDKLFSANLFGGGTVINYFGRSVPSRYVRILVNEWTKFPALRVGPLVDCASANAGRAMSTSMSTANPTAVQKNATSGADTSVLDLVSDVESQDRFTSEDVTAASEILNGLGGGGGE
jgi:hypothetical protein